MVKVLEKKSGFFLSKDGFVEVHIVYSETIRQVPEGLACFYLAEGFSDWARTTNVVEIKEGDSTVVFRIDPTKHKKVDFGSLEYLDVANDFDILMVSGLAVYTENSQVRVYKKE